METRVGSYDDLRPGQMRRVKVGEHAIALLRTSDGYHAYPAECPHYQGPLPDGVLHEGRLVCPWHHATYSIADGDLLEPPSFMALPGYPVRIEGGEVLVDVPDDTRGTRAVPMVDADPAHVPSSVLLIGAGAGGASAAESLRQNGFAGRILMVSAEDKPPYDRPNCSKDLLAGTIKPSWMPLRSPAFYEKHGIERVTGRVVKFSASERTAVLEDGRELSGDAVLLAPGGQPRRLPVPGADLPGVFTLRSWDDAEAIISAIEQGKRAVIVGASFIGLEVAASLRHRDLSVSVVSPEQIPLAAVFGEQIGAAVRALHEQNGVVFELGHGVQALEGDERVRRVVLDDGRALDADLAVVGIGVRPATSFVDGLQLGHDGSIAVDEMLMAAPGVWVAGDVARYPASHIGEPVRIEHWRLALQHGRAAGRTMAGRGLPFAGVPFFWSVHYAKTLRFAGYGPGVEERVVAGNVAELDFVAYFLGQGQVRAACGTRDRQVAAFAELMRSGDLPAAEELRDRPETDLTELLRPE